MLIIFGALKIELLPLLKSIHVHNIRKTGKTIIYEGYKNNGPVTIIQTGMGTKNAKSSAKLFEENYSEYIKRNGIRSEENMEVLMIGFCGATDRKLKVGDMITYSSIKNMEYSKRDSFVQDAILSLNRKQLSGSLLIHRSFNVTGGTVPEVITDPDIKKKLYADFDIQAIDMESYQIGKIVLEMRLPFQCVRIVSDGALDIVPAYYGGADGIKMIINIILSFLRSIFDKKELLANIVALKNLRKANLRLAEVSKTLFQADLDKTL